MAIERRDPDYDEIGFKSIKDPADEISSQDIHIESWAGIISISIAPKPRLNG
jgi:hypothetical protein